MDSPIEDLAKEWLRLDKDPKTRSEIQQLLADDNAPELELRLRRRMTFGTAGLRAKMQAGFAFLNPLTIIQTTQGLAEYLMTTDPHVKERGIVIGRDARFNSDRFQRLAVAVFLEKGIRVYCYGVAVHTPLVPFGVNHLNASAGIMITASHNPAQDNGYKVYWSNGCQIIPPYDAGIAAAIEHNLEPTTWDDSAVEDSILSQGELGQVRDAYYRAVGVAASLHHSPGFESSKTRFVYTPLHGVGLAYFSDVVARLGISGMVVVSEQADPDPNFPTVKFPNPEEKGALDLAIHTADAVGITLVLANDPDADRLAVAEKVDGSWRQLSGDQLGVLLASHVWETHPNHEKEARKKLAMLNSTVSSGMLAHVAQQEGFHHVETLTGFKWLGNVALDLEAQGYNVGFAYEEALGYMTPAVVHDKDGVAAAALFLTAVERWRQDGLTPWTRLQKLYEKYGYWADGNAYLVSPSPRVTTEAFASVRALGAPRKYPSHIGHYKIHRWRDLTEGYDSATLDYKPKLPVSRDCEMITVELEHGVRFTVRASGTEAKLKLYVDASSEKDLEAARAKAVEVRDLIFGGWFEPERWGLRVPG